MSLAEKNIFEDTGATPKALSDENKSYSEYLLKKAKGIPDKKWYPRSKYHESEQLLSVNFKSNPSKLKIYIKAFAYELSYYYQLEPSTIHQHLTAIYGLMEGSKDFDGLNIESDFKTLFETYILHLYEGVKNTVIGDKKKKRYAIQTARDHSLGILRFIIFLNSYSDKHHWGKEYIHTKIFPSKIAKYFDSTELQVYRNELRSLLNKGKTQAIPYNILYDVMKFVYKLPPSYIKTAIIIAAHTGLRMSEIRGLEIDCLTKVSETEIKTVDNYLATMKRAIVIRPDFSESYWLSGHLIFKGNRESPAEGAPILVGKEVKHAIDELIQITSKIREKADSRMLFINKIRNKQNPYGIRSYGALLLDRNKLVEQGMPFVKFHQFRATFATILYDLKVPIGMIEKYLNHVSSDVTAGYIASKKERSISLMNSVLSGRVAGVTRDESFHRFEQKLRSAVAAPEFAGMSFGSQASLFERLMKEHEIKISLSDHGHCVLPASEICPHGYEEVSPCHTSGCEKFKPDPEEKPFFVNLLSLREGQRDEIEKFAKEHGGLHVNMEKYDNDIASISNIIDLIEKVS